MAILDAHRRSIVLVPFPFQGHITPILQLGSILHSKGFSIIVAHTEFNSPNPLNHPDFLFLPLADGLRGLDTSFANMITVIEAINTNCRVPLQEYLVRLKKDRDAFGQVCRIIYDFVMNVGDAVAAHLKIPSMVLQPCNATYMHSLHVILQLQAENYFPLPESKLEDPVPDLHNTRFKDLQVRVTENISDVLLQHFSGTIDTGSSVAIIWNTTEELDQVSLSKLQQFYHLPCFPIGPFHKMASCSSTSLMKEDANCMIWLNKQAPNSVLYVSLGSLATIDEKELEEMAWGLANSGQPFLWVIRPSSVDGSQWIERLPKGFRETVGERGQIVTWAPQTKVLAHSAVGGFLSHCGWNSTLESISEAVPLICRPCFGDQLINCRHITYTWKVGLELENAWDRGVIESSIRRLMVEDEGRELRQRMLLMKQKLETSIQKGGCSHKSLNDLTQFIISLPDPQIDKATSTKELSYADLPELTT